MKIGHDSHSGGLNLVLTEDTKIFRDTDFSVQVPCMECATSHVGTAFIRKGIFRGVHTYDYKNPPRGKNGACAYDDV